MTEAYIEPEAHLTPAQTRPEDFDDEAVSSTFDRITEKMKHGRVTDTRTNSAGWGATEAMTNKYVTDFLDLAISDKEFDNTPYLNTVVHDWLTGKILSEADLNLLKRYYIRAVKSGKISLPREYLN